MNNQDRLYELAVELQNLGFGMMELAYQPYYVIPRLYEKYLVLFDEAVAIAKGETRIPKLLIRATWQVAEHIRAEASHSRDPAPMIKVADEIQAKFFLLAYE